MKQSLLINSPDLPVGVDDVAFRLYLSHHVSALVSMWERTGFVAAKSILGISQEMEKVQTGDRRSCWQIICQ
jgi:hypothetical protein